MIKSPLATATYQAHSGNYTNGRSGRHIEAVCLHHMAGVLSAKQCGEIFQTPGRGGSANYGIGKDGEIACYVGEENTSWANSNWDSNCKSVTIETSNCEYGGNWRVSDNVLNQLIRLVADIAARNNLGTLVKGKNLTWHSMFYSTACPGPYLLSRIDYIIQEANKINTKKSKVKYRGHIENIGWTQWVEDGKTIGTTGQGKRLEAIQIDCDKEVYAKAHIEDIGWVDYGKITKDTVIGTTGKAKRLECLCLKGNFKYRVHIQDAGWSTWTDADGICTLGSVGQCLRIEAIEII